MKGEERGNLYLFTGLILGVVLGLLYAWVVSPVKYIDTEPNSMSAYYKDRQRALIARAYLATGNVGRARARLELLEDPDLYGALSSQAQAALLDGTDPEEARALGLLSVAIGQTDSAPNLAPAATTNPPPALLLLSPSPTAAFTASPLLTVTPAASRTPLLSSPVTPGTQLATQSSLPPLATSSPTATAQSTATRAPTQTPGAPFALQSREPLCEPRLSSPMLQILVLDASENQVSGVEIILTWEGGVERFYTGLKPELGAGYADYVLDSGATYTLRLSEGGATVSGVTALQCPERSGESSWGAWLLTFAQP